MPRPFMETLRELRGGRTLEDLAENVAEIVKAVRATGKSGELTLKLKFKPPKAGGASYLMVEDSIAAKVPKLDHGDRVLPHQRRGVDPPGPKPDGTAARSGLSRYGHG